MQIRPENIYILCGCHPQGWCHQWLSDPHPAPPSDATVIFAEVTENEYINDRYRLVGENN